ncbi:hypothetical protein K450DRAFT_285896 [Umbelopsis ramanniana AG]|uniref:DRBM domain-containing protein n=1 Tax=Umbelopsis ramanniana AG TaxID=1314678 RepID=A0AAD5EF63_UMBRA|nr:uncharacterized protein K450DRAFT_285896 [Umbelopsis ramanniana AG]KAI8581816.1 hypothetical protein K450DRAFT_285896 [Umbelopsis ramanniana AG]
MPLNDTKTPVELLREYASAHNLNYRFAYKTVQSSYRPHARFECQVHIGEHLFEAGSDFATKSDAMYVAARVAIRSLMGETKSPEGDINSTTRSRCDFESAWGNLTVPWWANTKILVDRLQNLGGFTYSYILNEICKTNKIAIPLNIQYKEIKEGDFIAQLDFLNRLFYTAQSHASERDAKQDLSRIIVWTLLGKIDHRTVSRSVPSGQNLVTQATLHSSIEATTFSSAQSNQRDPVSWADVVVRRTSLSSSTAAHPGSTDLRSESYDQSSVATNSPKTTTTTATSVTTGDMASIGVLKDSGDLQPINTKMYPFPRMAIMPAALEVDDIHVDWPIASVFEHLDLDGPTRAEMEEFSSPSPSLLSELNFGASILTSSASSILSTTSRNTSQQSFMNRRSYNAPPPPPASTNAMSSTGWYQRDVSSRPKAFGYSSAKGRFPESTQSNYSHKDSNFRARQEPSTQMKLTSPYKASPWQGSGSQALMGLSEQPTWVKTAVTRLSDFMKLVYPNDSVIHYEQYYSSDGIRASVSCGHLGKFISRKAVGTQSAGTSYTFSEVIEDAASVALETIASQYF